MRVDCKADCSLQIPLLGVIEGGYAVAEQHQRLLIGKAGADVCDRAQRRPHRRAYEWLLDMTLVCLVEHNRQEQHLGPSLAIGAEYQTILPIT